MTVRDRPSVRPVRPVRPLHGKIVFIVFRTESNTLCIHCIQRALLYLETSRCELHAQGENLALAADTGAGATVVPATGNGAVDSAAFGATALAADAGMAPRRARSGLGFVAGGMFVLQRCAYNFLGCRCN